LADRVHEFLDGRRDRIRRQQRARAELSLARERLRACEETEGRSRELASELELVAPVPWASTEEKSRFWEAEDHYERTLESAELHRERALQHLLRAREDAPEDPEIRDALTEVYLERLDRAELLGDRFQQRFLETQLRGLDLPNLEELLEGKGSLSIRVEPTPTRRTLAPLVEQHRVWVPAEEERIELRDAGAIALAQGRYELRVEAEGRRRILVPVRIRRRATVELDLRLRTDDDIGAEFVQIPAGSFVMGGDDETFQSHPRQVRDVGEFAIARYPITFEEYREFVQSVADVDPEEAEPLLPHVSENRNVWGIDDGRVLYFETRRNWPVFGVDFEQAQRYCQWRSQRDGRRYRLPTDEEWEKAARGTDERIFPWGDRFDASFCKNAESTEGKAQPEAVGAYPIDCSPYGVRDMAGGIREWCDSWYSEKDGQRLVRGGSWNFTSIGAHCAYRMGCAPHVAYPFIGFRIVHDFG
ncbi:MAG: SUMF1/EgtB/PvdO family nonheme iron enzyme, partial [Planctomycetes bacterium]|nr:SUMF1/EgtB/PvdO family nonheme iron enzyme [Planctomycetota bacterium]